MLTFLGAILAGLVCGVLSGFGIGGGSLLIILLSSFFGWLAAVRRMIALILAFTSRILNGLVI